MPVLPHHILQRAALLAGLAALVLALTAVTAPAQVPGEKPVMQNTFFNVIWGSAMGGLLGGASASLSAGDRTKPSNFRDEVITGATFGGVVGLGVGIYLTFTGISFDADRSLLFADNRPESGSGMLAQRYTPPFEIETAPGEPFRITGVKALILHLRF